MKNSVIIGASVPVGVDGIKLLKTLKLGDFALTKVPDSFDEAMSVAEYCRENEIYFMFSEWLFRGSRKLLMSSRREISREDFFTKKQADDIAAAGGKFYLGRMALGEAGGLLYWAKEYIIDRACRNYVNLPLAETVEEARDEYVNYMEETIVYEREELGGGKIWDVDSSMTFKYHAQAGFDGLVIESMPGDCHFLYSALRGAAKAYDKPFGAHIAIGCYGGAAVYDRLRLRRWQVSLYYSYLSGCGFIYPESGYFANQKYSFDSEEMKTMRRILREVYQFSKTHTRPSKGPEVKIAFVHGHLDGHPGLWNKYVWGQYEGGDKWLFGAAEKGWDYVGDINRKEDWSNPNIRGEIDFSGHPSGGLFDIAPIEAPLEILQQYSCLIFLGWNTMTDEIYEKLKQYVENGGRLFMSVPHLNIETDRGNDLKLYNDGDFEDLFGVKIKGAGIRNVHGIIFTNDSDIPGYVFSNRCGDPAFMGDYTLANCEIRGAKVIAGAKNAHDAPRELAFRKPVLVENKLGEGFAMLLTTWSWPGEYGLSELTKDILRAIYAGEKDKIMINGSDRIRHAVYDNDDCKVVYLLNTDLDDGHAARLWISGKDVARIEIPSAEILPVYVFEKIAIIPVDKFTNIDRCEIAGERISVGFFTKKKQQFDIVNISTHSLDIVVNGIALTLSKGERKSVLLDKRVDERSIEFYSDDFTCEPEISWSGGGLPY